MYSNKYDKVTGIWTRKAYILMKKLGSGGIGDIYLVEDQEGRMLALKASTDMISITKEYNFLKRFQDKEFVPQAYDLDDFTKNGKTYHYFTMEYIQGYNLKHGLKKSNLDTKTKLDIICLITNIIRQINEAGYIYTDLKHENIMVDGRKGQIRLVDLGSLVEVGSTVKEFTPMYDRLCWGRGRRIADISYQIFVIGMLFVSMLLNRSLNPEKEKLENAMVGLKKKRIPRTVYQVIVNCIDGNVKDCGTLYHEISCAIDNSQSYPDRLKLMLNVIISILSLMFIATIFAFQ